MNRLKPIELLGVLLMGMLGLSAAYMIFFEGYLPAKTTNSVHTFRGIEKAVGIMPLGFGLLFLAAAFYDLKAKLKEKQKKGVRLHNRTKHER